MTSENTVQGMFSDFVSNEGGFLVVIVVQNKFYFKTIKNQMKKKEWAERERKKCAHLQVIFQ